MVRNRTPEAVKRELEDIDFDVKPLAKGKYRGIPFEEGGGYRINYRGDGYFQYHPRKGSRHNGEYYKRASAKDGIRRFDRTGDEKYD